MKKYKCQFCDFTVLINSNNKKNRISFKHRMGEHYETNHKDLLPKGMTGYQWFYYLMTKKQRGSCIMCHNDTEFNEMTMKYSRFCRNPLCKQKYKSQVDNNMIGKYGKVHLLDDPEMQKKMQQGRRISGVYKWSDNSAKFPYMGSYELDFLQFLDLRMDWPSSDVMAPSPHTYTYEYNNKKHFYMPDFFIPSMNCEVEIKDDGSALNINKESREKDKIKHELMLSCSSMFNYIKIINKDYTKFMEMMKGD